MKETNTVLSGIRWNTMPLSSPYYEAASVKKIMQVWQIKQFRLYMEGCIFSYGYFTVSWQPINAKKTKKIISTLLQNTWNSLPSFIRRACVLSGLPGGACAFARVPAEECWNREQAAKGPTGGAAESQLGGEKGTGGHSPGAPGAAVSDVERR